MNGSLLLSNSYGMRRWEQISVEDIIVATIIVATFIWAMCGQPELR